jgi:hypothetical protein
MSKESRTYMQNGYKYVEGWYSYLALKTVSELAEFQKQHFISGSICEIGVHHGRSFILLSLLTNSPESSVAYDLFEMQSENIDRSGKGNKEILRKNLQRFNCDLNRIKIVSQNSLSLTPELLLNDTNCAVRIFSIDGGHTSDVVLNDLNLAEKTICKGGIIIIDDFFDEGWPGVAEGTCKHLMQTNSKLIPFAVFDDKVAFTNDIEMKNLYIKTLESLCPEFLSKESEFFGNKIVILYKSKNEFINKLRRTKIWQRIKNNRIGNSIRRVMN